MIGRDMTPPSGEIITVVIDEVDIPNRVVHVSDRTGGRFHVTFRAFGSVIQIPMIGEHWTAKRVGFQWYLDAPVSQSTIADQIGPGDVGVFSVGDIHLNSTESLFLTPGADVHLNPSGHLHLNPTGDIKPVGDIVMDGSSKVKNLAAGSVAGDSLRYEQLFTSGTLALLGSLDTDSWIQAMYGGWGSSIFNGWMGLWQDGNDYYHSFWDSDEIAFGPGTGPVDVSLKRTAANILSMGAGDKLQQNAAPTVGDDLTNKTYVDLKAPLASPALTGTPTAPTATGGTNTTQIATTAFVQAALGSYLTSATAASTYMPLAGGTFTGNVTIDRNGAATTGRLTVDVDGGQRGGFRISEDGTPIWEMYKRSSNDDFRINNEVLASPAMTISSTTNVADFNETPTKDGTNLGLTCDIQVFTSSGTWTKPTVQTPKAVFVRCIGGGGGGGGGESGTTGTNRAGGSGGNAGGFVERWFRASDLSATETVTIGAGGAGGAGGGDGGGSGNGSNGTSGGDTTFGTTARVKAGGGAGGVAGAGGVSGVSAVGATRNHLASEDSSSAARAGNGNTGSAAAGSNGRYGRGPGAGGGGGGMNGTGSGNYSAGGNGGIGDYSGIEYAGGTGSTGGSSAPTAGSSSSHLLGGGGGGGGGGGSQAGSHAGANGGDYGGGGGGGGAAPVGYAGTGGNGASGLCVVFTYF